MSSAAEHIAKRPFDLAQVRADFPALTVEPYGKRLAFLDSAASAQKPQAVIDRIAHAYAFEYANIHRGVYHLSQLATENFEAARRRVAQFLNAKSDREIVFTRGATEAINLVAHSWGRSNLGAGDEIILTHLEHHANIVPWQMLRDELGVVLNVVPIDEDGQIDFAAYQELLGPKTKLVAMSHMSNALGTITPMADVIAAAHAQHVPVLVDGCQAVPHMAVDVQALDADFYVFSGHKLYGPSGIGALYAKLDLLEAMPPYQTGGEMILSVSFEETEFNEVPHKFEAGTPNIVGAIGLAAAMDYVDGFDRAEVEAHEQAVLDYATEQLRGVNGLRLIGTAADKAAVLSFVMDGIHPHDAGTILDRDGIAVRAGQHCAEPAMDRFDVPATIRASIGMHTGFDDIDQLVRGLARVREMLG